MYTKAPEVVSGTSILRSASDTLSIAFAFHLTNFSIFEASNSSLHNQFQTSVAVQLTFSN